MYKLLLFIFNFIIMGRIKKDEVKPKIHEHTFDKWMLYDVSILNEYTFNDITKAHGRITIFRICNICGNTERIEYDTAFAKIGPELDETINKLIQYLNETIMYVKPKPEPKPIPIPCKHEWSKRGIVSEAHNDEYGEIIVQRYCLLCGDSETMKYQTDMFDDDVVAVSNSLKRLKEHIQSTLIESDIKTSEAEILDTIKNFANGVNFIEVSQCDKLAKNIHLLINKHN